MSDGDTEATTASSRFYLRACEQISGRRERLRDEHGVYLVGSGRINVAGLNEGNLDRVCAAMAAVAG